MGLLENKSTDHQKGIAPVPLWVRPEPRRPRWDYRSPIIADGLHAYRLEYCFSDRLLASDTNFGVRSLPYNHQHTPGITNQQMDCDLGQQSSMIAVVSVSEPYRGISLIGCARLNDEMAEKSQLEIPEDLNTLEGVDVTEVVRNSPVLARLVEEVRNKQVEELNAYNRMHNRHNRTR